MIEVLVMPSNEPEKSFEDFFRYNVNFAVETLRQSGQVHTMVIGQAKGKVLLAMLPFSNQIEKVVMFEEVKALLSESSVTMYCVMNEAWSAPVKDFNLDNYKHGDAEKSPDRVECLVVANVSHSNRKMKMLEIKRDENKNILSVDCIHTLVDDEVQGAMMEFLPTGH